MLGTKCFLLLQAKVLEKDVVSCGLNSGLPRQNLSGVDTKRNRDVIESFTLAVIIEWLLNNECNARLCLEHASKFPNRLYSNVTSLHKEKRRFL